MIKIRHPHGTFQFEQKGKQSQIWKDNKVIIRWSDNLKVKISTTYEEPEEIK